MKYRVGIFELEFEDSGKLAGLAADGMSPFLADARRREDMGGGRWFEPRGWDECFPTIEPYGDSPVLGDLIWRKPRFVPEEASVSVEWEAPGYVAVRRFRAENGRQLVMDFAVRLGDGAPMKFLWASHALFTFRGLRRAEFGDGAVLDDFSLDGTSSKTFRPNCGPVRLVREDGEVLLETDQPWWGIWYNRGGWPAGRPASFGALGLEATNTASDLPGEAELGPGGEFRGTVRIAVRRQETR